MSEPASEALHTARRRAASTWAMRASVELGAATRFRRIASRLEETGAEPVVLELARRASRDEERHAELCDELTLRLSPAPRRRATGGDAQVAEIAPGGLTARERVLYEVVATSCITETLSTALLGELRDGATDARVREVLHEILRDEVLHARLGWAHLASEARRGPTRFLAEALPAMLDDTVTDEVFRCGEPDLPEVASALRGLGALPRAERRGHFAETLESVVLPGFDALGVDTSGARDWLATRLRDSATPR